MNVTPDNKILVQGISEEQGSIYAARMKSYGTNIVAGTSAGHGGQLLHGIPVFDLVEQAIVEVGAIDTTIIFVPAYAVLDAALEAITSGIRQIILITGGIPPLDMVKVLRKAEATKTLVLGSSSSGIIVPGKILLGTHESKFYTPGNIGIIGRTGTLTYEVAWELTQANLGQSVAVSIGSDPIVGSSVVQWLQILAADKNTKAIVLVNHIGVPCEETAAKYIVEELDKPVVAYLAGRKSQKKLIGHANAISLRHREMMFASQREELASELTPEERQIAAFKQANIPIADSPSQIPDLVKKALKK